MKEVIYKASTFIDSELTTYEIDLLLVKKERISNKSLHDSIEIHKRNSSTPVSRLDVIRRIFETYNYLSYSGYCVK